MECLKIMTGEKSKRMYRMIGLLLKRTSWECIANAVKGFYFLTGSCSIEPSIIIFR